MSQAEYRNAGRIPARSSPRASTTSRWPPTSATSRGRIGLLVAVLCIAYTVFHIGRDEPLPAGDLDLPDDPSSRAGCLIGFLIYSALTLDLTTRQRAGQGAGPLELALMAIAVAGILYGWLMVAYAWARLVVRRCRACPPASSSAPTASRCSSAPSRRSLRRMVLPDRRTRTRPSGDWLPGLAALAVLGYIIFNVGALRLRAGTAHGPAGRYLGGARRASS